MTEQQTPGYGLPLPAPGNPLAQDVLRLIDALQKLDTELIRIDEAVAARAFAAQVQASLQSLQQSITQLTSGKVASVNGIAGINITLNPEHLALGPANGAATTGFGYDGQGRVTSMSSTLNGQTAATTISYDGAGRVYQQQTSYRGRMRTETYSYDAVTGRVSGVNATEVQG